MVATEERKIAARQNAAKDEEKHHVSTKQAKGKEA